jgi:arylsulfatase A-like enzyme
VLVRRRQISLFFLLMTLAMAMWGIKVATSQHHHIDSIAHNGVLFTDGYVTCPVCAPSRAGLLTGRYQQRFGFADNPGPFQRKDARYAGIPPSQPILSERLQALGYSTGIFGKTHDGVAEEQMAFDAMG